jgi:hypothetical protein
MKLRFTALSFLAAAAVMASVAPSLAQFYPYPPPQPRPYYGPGPYGPGPYGPPGYYRPYQPVIFGNLCVTSRGNCRTQPQPNGSGCRCFIPGFGPKRGNILARTGW